MSNLKANILKANPVKTSFMHSSAPPRMKILIRYIPVPNHFENVHFNTDVVGSGRTDAKPLELGQSVT
jgi:hypothetical protein